LPYIRAKKHFSLCLAFLSSGLGKAIFPQKTTANERNPVEKVDIPDHWPPEQGQTGSSSCKYLGEKPS
jgi:hypothetical protein